MPINFNCPHCQKPLKVKDELAGKKGPCPACKKLLTVPQPAAAPKAAAPPPPAPNGSPAPAPADVEAEAAALFADGPAKAEAPVQFIDFPCPQCDEPLHLDAALAGKKTPCPSCRRIISVPLPKVEKKDWRSLDTRLPSGAQRPTEPAPEGAWGSTEAKRVSTGALDEAGLIPQKRVPRTAGQKVRRGLLAAGAVALVAVVAVVGWKWWAAGRQERALKNALAFINSEPGKKLGAPGQAAIHTGAGEYFLRSRKPQCGKLAAEQLGQAFGNVSNANADAERDLALTELALAQVGLGGDPEDLEREVRLKWDEVMKRLRSSLDAIRSPEAKLEALRGVAGRLAAARQSALVVPLTRNVYTAEGPDKYEAMSAVALELQKAGDEKSASEAANEALSPYAPERKDRPPLRAPVVVLAHVLKRPVPAAKKGSVEDEKLELIGQAEGLARQGQWEQARDKVRAANKYEAEVPFRALVGVAAAAVDTNAQDKSDLEAALRAAETMQKRPEVAWPLLRLTRVALRAGQTDRAAKAADAVAGPVRGQAQLLVLRARLAAAQQVVGEDAAKQVEGKGLAHLLGREALARHNVRHDSGWAKVVQGWEEPERAFGSLGIALGMQGKD
jgi:hypothetical protein